MKKSLLILFCGLFAIATLYSCKPSDTNLQKDVNSALTVSYPEVSASVHNGVATLTGTVNSETDKIGAEQTAKAVKHIKSVNNNIMVNAPAPPPAISYDPDHVITDNISTRLTDSKYKDVNVEVRDGEVILTGKAKRDDLQHVMQVANEARAKKVVNQLTVVD